MADKLEEMASTNHPNRGQAKHNRATANPTPSQVSQLRASANLTQTEFGALVYKGWRTVQDWESGERRMPPDTYELAQIKIKARELLKRGRIAPLAIKDLGLQLPDEDQ